MVNVIFSDISATLWQDSCPVPKFRPAAGHPTPLAARGPCHQRAHTQWGYAGNWHGSPDRQSSQLPLHNSRGHNDLNSENISLIPGWKKGYLFTIDTMGSSSLSPSTAVQFISIAPGAPGEHGVKRSSQITSGFDLDGPRTWNFCTQNFNFTSKIFKWDIICGTQFIMNYFLLFIHKFS